VKRLIAAIVIGAAFLFPSTAEARGYQYDLIKADYTVNVDSTVDVVESQIFRYDGSYNKGWRSISRKLTSAITDISVWDGETGKELIRSSFDLEKTDPKSWGKYHISEGSGSVDVSWYYDLKDTTHEWIVKYKLHGAISFLSDKDELYWNAIGDGYDASISEVVVRVTIPEGAEMSELSSAVYIDENDGSFASGGVIDDRTFEFSARNILPNSFVTIAAGWPKGLVDQEAFWKDLFLIYWQWPAMILLIPFFIILWKLIRRNKLRGRGVIVPHYGPPRGMKPAEAEYLLSAYSSNRAWSATMIDLAVRGYISIEERDLSESERKMKQLSKTIGKVIIMILGSMFGLSAISFIVESIGSFEIALIIPTLVTGSIAFLIFRAAIKKKPGDDSGAYVVKRTDKKTGDDIAGYEEFLMDAMLTDGELDMTSVKNSPKGTELAGEMAKAGRVLVEEIDPEGRLIMRRDMRAKIIIGVTVALAIIGIIVMFSMFFSDPFWAVFIAGSMISISIIASGSRLTKEGRILREEWLGFKLYLETAEKYRIQNLTPDLFEKYLPYAMMFGIERKWARSFEGMAVPSPAWYSGSATSFGAGGAVSGFSASSFSTGFSASFSSIFSTSSGSSSGSGGSGGGGSSGGGGGGGGGGAS